MCMTQTVLVGWMITMGASLPTSGANTVHGRVEQYGDAASRRWAPYFKRAGIAYPPQAVTLIGLKEEKTLEVYAAGTNGSFQFIRSLPVLAASGNLGPKLREGDLQVPEGIYGIEALNPNSAFHLSLRVNYPNQDDRARAKEDKRSRLGGDIMIHGKAVSAGCLAMGDEAAEDLFGLAALAGLFNITVILSPLDFRVRDLPQMPAGAPRWTAELYATIKAALVSYKRPNERGAGQRESPALLHAGSARPARPEHGCYTRKT